MLVKYARSAPEGLFWAVMRAILLGWRNSACKCSQSEASRSLSPSPYVQACAWAIDELKATVPIWKKEFLVGGEVWKENAESRAASLSGATK